MCRSTTILSRKVGDSGESEAFHADRDDMILVLAGVRPGVIAHHKESGQRLTPRHQVRVADRIR